MIHSRRFLRAVLAVVTTLVGLCATPAAWSADAYPKEIRIGVQKGDGLVALRMSGNLEKAFAPHHVTVKWIEFVYGAPLVEAINSGDVDVGTVGSTPPILAQAGSAPAVVYAAYSPKMQKSYGIIVAKNSSIRTIRDLQGKKIAFAKGSQGHLLVLGALADAGIDPASTHFVYLAYSDARAAFERGDVDAWAVPDPRYADTELSTGARTIVKIGDISIPQYGFYISTRAFASTYPAALRVLFDQLDQQTKYSLAHPE
ncbi:aliphatic sulfonate ABC transporter substrate-binding protein [Paraburkholderia fungorum]|uniref:aliphatic sulfonate ABC transporter substrate-binding protein n=1 Tax=Paraburkholderia fungorum TaxID=134537 RepID=UPI0038B72BC4